MSTPSNIINFKKCVGNTKTTGRGIPVGQNLIVSYAIGSTNTYQIWRMGDGRLFIPTTFTDLDEAVEIAKWWDELYTEYWCILSAYPDADIVSLAKWSVTNGIRIFEMIKEMGSKQVTKDQLNSAWENADVKGWIRG